MTGEAGIILGRDEEHNARAGLLEPHDLSVPEHPYCQQRFGWRPQQWPEAMRLGIQTMSLPRSPAMTDGDVARVMDIGHPGRRGLAGCIRRDVIHRAQSCTGDRRPRIGMSLRL